MKSINQYTQTPFHVNATLWMLLMLLFAGGTFAVDLNHSYGPWLVTGLGAGGLVSFAFAFWSLGRNHLGDRLIRANLISEASPDGLMISDLDGNFLHANPAFYSLLSFVLGERSRQDITSWEALVDCASGFEQLEGLKDFITGTLGKASEFSIITMPNKDGFNSCRLSARRISPSEGVERIFWRIENLPDSHEVDTNLQFHGALLADYIDYLPVGFFSADSDGVILYANQTLARWIGLPPDRIVGTPFADYVSDVGADGQLTLKDIGGRVFEAGLEQSQKDGLDGDIAYTRSVVFRDLVLPDTSIEQTSRKNETETDVLMSSDKITGLVNDRLRWLFDEAPVGMILLDLTGAITDCNKSFLKLVAHHREAVLGEAFAERISKEDRGDVIAALSKIVMGTARATHMEVRMPGNGANEYIFSLYASPLGDAAGEVNGIVLYLVDSTEQKNLEVQFAQSQKMQAVGQLAGGVAHDFNNLLTAMLGFCDLLLARHGPDDPSFSDIQQIRQNANRAANLVRQLLAFSRKQTLQPIRLEIPEALSDLSNLIRRLIGETVTLTMEPGIEIWPVKGDRNQFDQIVINLCVNSRDAMPRGGEILIRTQNIQVDAPIQRGHDLIPIGDYVRIDVVDTGTGISKENMERIFDPFFTTKEAGAGTGLGLSTVYGIVHQSSGFIFADSAPGEGTTFTIYLPRFVDQETPSGLNSPLDAISEASDFSSNPEIGDLTGEGTVLLVEDEDAVRMFATRALENKGYRVLNAANGELALDVINATEDKIDIIVSDVIMPGMDGHTLVNLVRHEIPEIKVILMSGYAEDMLEEIERDPSLNFLGKPFTLKDLALKVKEVLGAQDLT